MNVAQIFVWPIDGNQEKNRSGFYILKKKTSLVGLYLKNSIRLKHLEPQEFVKNCRRTSEFLTVENVSIDFNGTGSYFILD